MDWSYISKKVPAWLLVFVILISLGIVVERIYWSKKPIILFGAYFGPPPEVVKSEDKHLSEENPSLVQDVGEIRIELKECKGAGSTIKCLFVANNSGQPEDLFVTAYETLLTAPDGSQYKTKKQTVGNNTNETDVGGTMARLPRGVSVQIIIWFMDVKRDFSTASLVDLAFSNSRHLEFRNVPIQK